MVLVMYLTVVRYDSVKFLITKNDIPQARLAVKQLYKYANVENVDDYIDKIRQNCGGNTSGLTFIDAICHPQYRKATWVNVGYIVFHELTGINVILMYSSQIFKEMHNSGSTLTPK